MYFQMQVISLKYTHTNTTLVAYERDFRFSTASGNVPAIWVHSPLRIKAEKKKFEMHCHQSILT